MTREEAIQTIRNAAQRGDPDAVRAWNFLLRGADPAAPAFLKAFGHILGRPQGPSGMAGQQQVQHVRQPMRQSAGADSAQQQVQHVQQPRRHPGAVDGAQQQIQHVQQHQAAPVDDRDQEVVYDGMGDGVDGIDDVEAIVDDGEHEAGDGLAGDLEDEDGAAEEGVDWNDPEALCGGDDVPDDDEAG